MAFVDASYLVAVLDARDQWHDKVNAAQFASQRGLRTHALALGEVVAIIGSRRGGRAARDAYESIRDSIEVLAPTIDDLDAALPHVTRSDGQLSLSDALFVHFAHGERRPSIYSFDADFDATPLHRIPSKERA